jgi:hypothetical protein
LLGKCKEIEDIKELKEQCFTFSIRRDLETNNKFWIDVGVHIHIPYYIVSWIVDVIHPTIKVTTTGTKLSSAKTEMLHIPHNYTTKDQVPNPIFVNITVTSTVNKPNLNPSLTITTE